MTITREAFALETEPQADSAEGRLESALLAENLPEGQGNELLRDVVLVDSTVARTVRTVGIPAAIEMHGTWQFRWFALYYRDIAVNTWLFQEPILSFNAQSILPRDSQIVYQSAEVPRSVRRLAFQEGPFPPPWPDTIPAVMEVGFGVPTFGNPPLPNPHGQSWSYLSRSLSSEMRSVGARYASRVNRLFAPLADANPAPGLTWRVVPFDSFTACGFGTPDGTVFISSGLLEHLTDGEVVAVIAHVMGHERYQHYPTNLEAAETLRRAQQPGSPAPQVPRYPEVLATAPYAYTRYQEIDANRLAVEYLSRVGIPPDVLFDALAKLSEQGEATGGEWPAFAKIHRLPRTAADLGRLLDAGHFRSREPD